MSSYIASQINRLAVRLIVMADIAGRDLDRAEARRLAAKQIAQETRARRAHRTILPVPTGAPTLETARAFFIAKIEALAARLANPISPSRSAPPSAVRKAAKPSDELGGEIVPQLRATRRHVNKQFALVEPTPSTPSPTIGVYAGNVGSAELIDEAANFHTSLRWSSRPLDNWKKSIEQADQATARRNRGSTWIG
jgi:hypothetical protein